MPSYNKAHAAYELAKEKASEADQDALFACIKVLQAENELLHCEKVASRCACNGHADRLIRRVRRVLRVFFRWPLRPRQELK